MTAPSASTDHIVPDGFDPVPPPLTAPAPSPRPTPAEAARTLLAQSRTGALASLSEDGAPWASLVMYGLLDDGTPALLLSTLAEHGRNLARDARASLMVAAPPSSPDPLASGRVTLAGRAVKPTGERESAAHAACLAAMASAKVFAEFGDVTLWTLEIERVRWVGGYGTMGSADAAAYAAAAPDPTAERAAHAVEHLNEDHPDALLAMAQELGGYADALRAQCTSIDRHGLDLAVFTPRGVAPIRIGFAEAVSEPDGLRAATVELARRAREAGAS
jgi:putative heme iron utilization protein